MNSILGNGSHARSESYDANIVHVMNDLKGPPPELHKMSALFKPTWVTGDRDIRHNRPAHDPLPLLALKRRPIREVAREIWRLWFFPLRRRRRPLDSHSRWVVRMQVRENVLEHWNTLREQLLEMAIERRVARVEVVYVRESLCCAVLSDKEVAR